jgi:hypothetical protein
MRTLYEVTANGSTVYNGEDEARAERTRTEWRIRGYTVELLTVDVPEIIEAEPAQAASFAVANPAATMTRKEALKIIWRHTHRDFRGRNFATGGSDKCVLILRAGGTCSVDLDALTDAEIADKLLGAWSAEQRRIVKVRS